MSPKNEPVVLLKRKETSKSALLRPPQLLLNPNTSLRTPSPTTSSLKEMPDAVPLPNPPVLTYVKLATHFLIQLIYLYIFLPCKL